MLSLYDMMMQAQNGNAVETMARQFGLAQEQAAKAIAALMPAFSEGFKRNAANPYDLAAFMTALTSGDHVKYFEDISKAFTPQGLAEGNGILGHLFGNKDVSRAIAAQAAQMTGIGQDIYKQMLPVMASTLMGGLFKQSFAPFFPGAEAGKTPANPFADMMQQWAEATGMARKREPANPFTDNPFMQAAQEFFGTKKEAPANPFTDNPFAKAFQDMVAGMAGQPAGSGKTAEQADSPADSLKSFVNTMFDTGLEMQKDYQRNVESIFETIRSRMEPDGGKKA
ncbi:DUF937 domain-containing protein [Shinella yambaruensis]|uniref:DUF937 domain-containing protein n=1 Tax=Shinella yambaruensis TaxID=415996 RepID=A0ABQ5ZIF8_9HYPH|nr:DUF937 domain-containing protein [Shinella yambaruensis]MCJ8026546.1 DUF937 domain-containing protein [Shinella yambaruensis]MCU7982340.1 DUF937 domain-containing protein [Shinella yambaruensis]GLR51840.1 hypothetical protein GCM10007923_30500 [Shinella yambaruensis]